MISEKDMLLNSAVHEIQDLRKQNSEMRLRLTVYDEMTAMFFGGPKQSNQGYSEDIAWKIKKHLEKQDSTPASS